MWRARQRRLQGSRDDWFGLLERLLRYLPGSTIEGVLGLAPGTVGLWHAAKSVPFAARDDLLELVKRAPKWRWSEDETEPRET